LVDRSGKAAFFYVAGTAAQIDADPVTGTETLRVLRLLTFDWLHDECARAGVAL
jgi:hypothetical protein